MRIETKRAKPSPSPADWTETLYQVLAETSSCSKKPSAPGFDPSAPLNTLGGPEVRTVPSGGFPGPGLLVYFLERVEGARFGEPPCFDPATASPLYRALAHGISGRLVVSCRVLSDGGLAAAAAESCLEGRQGADLCLDRLPGNAPEDSALLLFSESPFRLLVSIRREDRERFDRSFHGLPARLLGTTTADPRLLFRHAGRIILSASLDDIEAACKIPAGRA